MKAGTCAALFTLPASLALLALACASTTPAIASASAGGPPVEGADAAPQEDGGAARNCVHDTRDLAPCVEDCDRRIAFACTVLASRLERGDGVAVDLTRAVRLHERACELLDAASCVSAARMHASGAGVPPSRARQIELLVMACRLGDPIACTIPARALATGAGVPRDERRASELWERACAGGVSAACDEIDAGT